LAEIRNALYRAAINGNVEAMKFFLLRRDPDFQEGGALQDEEIAKEIKQREIVLTLKREAPAKADEKPAEPGGAAP
jgi:hypothetical protein